MKARILVPLAFLAAGLAAAYGPMLGSSLTRMQVDKGDTRHLNWVLEHGWRWATGWPGHADVWSPPAFWPEAGTAAYSETLLGVVPFYGVFRAFGAEPDTALQLFMLLASVLNFAAFFALLRRPLGLSAVAASFGAFLFAYGSVRNVQIGHQHLLLHVFSVAALYACTRLWGRVPAEGRARTAWCVALVAAFVAQVWAGFYLAWFLALALSCALVWTLVLPETRTRLLARWRFDAPRLLVFGLLGAAALWPMAVRYAAAARTVGIRNFDEIVPMLPGPAAYANMGAASWLYGWTADAGVFRALAPLESEKRLGLGLVTLALVVWGLASRRRDAFVRVVLLTMASLAVLSLLWPGGHTLWRAVYAGFPAGSAIRAVPRVGLVLLFGAAAGLAFAAERLEASGRTALLAALGVLVVLEQGQTLPSYDKAAAREQVGRIARAIPSGCRAFFYSPLENRGRAAWETQVDAMWASMETGVPTVNGYSSNFPPGWMPLHDHNILKERPTDEERLRAALDAWLAAHGVSGRDVCWVQVPEPPS